MSKTENQLTVQTIFLLSFKAFDIKYTFLILNEKYRMSSCTTCLIINSDSPMLWNWLICHRCQTWPGSQPHILEFFPFHNDQSKSSELPYHRNYNWNLLPGPQIGTSDGNSSRFQISGKLNCVRGLISTETMLLVCCLIKSKTDKTYVRN